jgi:hypothetical protein
MRALRTARANLDLIAILQSQCVDSLTFQMHRDESREINKFRHCRLDVGFQPRGARTIKSHDHN